MSERLDHPLPLTKRFLLKFHVGMCKMCETIDRQITGLRKTFIQKSNAEFHLSSSQQSLSEEARLRIKSSLKQNNYQEG